MAVIGATFLKMLAYLGLALAAVLALPATNALCFAAFEVPDEHGESVWKAFTGPFRLLWYGDDEFYQ
jgi:hypothetical protein